MSVKRTFSAIMVGACCLMANAQEINMPIIQTKYTADPAPFVHNDTIYLYTTHDEDNSEGFNMQDWLLYTSTDMVNWQDHGAVASLKNFKWYKGITVPGPNKSSNATANGTCIAPSMETVSVYWWPILPMVLSKTLSESPSFGNMSIGTTSTPV